MQLEAVELDMCASSTNDRKSIALNLRQGHLDIRMETLQAKKMIFFLQHAAGSWLY